MKPDNVLLDANGHIRLAEVDINTALYNAVVVDITSIRALPACLAVCLAVAATCFIVGQKDFHKKDDQISGSEHKENLLRSALLFSSFLSVVMSRWIHPCMCMFLLVFGRLLMLIYTNVCVPQSGTTTVYLFLPVMQYHVVIF